MGWGEEKRVFVRSRFLGVRRWWGGAEPGTVPPLMSPPTVPRLSGPAGCDDIQIARPAAPFLHSHSHSHPCAGPGRAARATSAPLSRRMTPESVKRDEHCDCAGTMCRQGVHETRVIRAVSKCGEDGGKQIQYVADSDPKNATVSKRKAVGRQVVCCWVRLQASPGCSPSKHRPPRGSGLCRDGPDYTLRQIDCCKPYAADDSTSATRATAFAPRSRHPRVSFTATGSGGDVGGLEAC